MIEQEMIFDKQDLSFFVEGFFVVVFSTFIPNVFILS